MCWQQLPGLIVTGRSTIGADACGLLSAPIAKLSSHSWGNTRSRSHDGLGAGIRDAWIVGNPYPIRLLQGYSSSARNRQGPKGASNFRRTRGLFSEFTSMSGAFIAPGGEDPRWA